MLVRGLTIIRPWPWAIAWGPKRIENRDWSPPQEEIREGLWIALHGGRKWDEDAFQHILALWGEGVGYRGAAGQEGIVAVARIAKTVPFVALQAPRSPWATGRVCWILEDVQRLPCAVPAKGALGLWELKPRALEAVLPFCRSVARA